ncbi:MAG: tRNA (adenosine(37)-N6)-threonylcarbamoyltransferase complex dimerization subunit type 1 TsaB [Gammaproteobacteria bacterium]|nr:tRNA (adenosine(37)-N6)-threonylcarbamoyltransferase complex dimerization subunit type 1 TsaB [Gammaproteobacteria bacterium]
MNILALDSSTEACSAAFLRQDGQVFSKFEIAPRQHTRLLPQMMNAVLAEAECSRSSLDACAFCNGPGAFTGIRIAAATAQGIGIALNIPLLPVSSLATLAQVSLDRQAAESTLVALDARMGEVYWACYRRDAGGIAQLNGAEMLDKVADVTIKSDVSHGAGHGWIAGKDIWQYEQSISVDDALFPDAESLIKLAKKAIENQQSVPADQITINYLRNKVAEKSVKK